MTSHLLIGRAFNFLFSFLLVTNAMECFWAEDMKRPCTHHNRCHFIYSTLLVSEGSAMAIYRHVVRIHVHNLMTLFLLYLLASREKKKLPFFAIKFIKTLQIKRNHIKNCKNWHRHTRTNCMAWHTITKYVIMSSIPCQWINKRKKNKRTKQNNINLHRN